MKLTQTGWWVKNRHQVFHSHFKVRRKKRRAMSKWAIQCLSLRAFFGYITGLEAAEKLDFTCRFLKHLLWERKLGGCPSNHRSQILLKGKNLKRCAKIITYLFCVVLANYFYGIFASTNKQLEMEDLSFLPSNKVVILRINFELSGKHFCTNPYIYFAFRLYSYQLFVWNSIKLLHA